MEIILIAILALALLVVVILVVSAPLRRPRAWSSQDNELSAGGGPAPGAGREEPARERGAELDRDGGLGPVETRAELEAAREAKYREIRDTELDYRTGKLSQEDFAATDGALRAEAVEILDRLAALEGEGATESEG